MIRILIIGILMSCFTLLSAQELEVISEHKRSSESKAAIRFTPDTLSVYSVRVLDPSGNLMTVAVKKKILMQGESVDFDLNTKFWRRGTYMLIAENERGVVKTKRLFIDPTK